MTAATWITLSRMLGIPLILYFLNSPSDRHRWIGCIVFLVAALTDWLDGYVARRFDQVSDLGKFLDPLVDKLLVFAPLLVLIEWGVVPTWAVFLILARELTIAGWRVQQTQISGANLWGKAKTVTQILAIAILISPLPDPWPLVGIWVFALAVALTLISGALYLVPREKAPSI
jgi:CDP-diacylglycerol--glycerol-3-phosphate 3-phosphatidyltransferase